jgi:acyl transferase domain-containing protein
MTWQGGFSALSNFGFGGSNVHMVLHGKARPQAATIEIKAEDANIGITAGPMPCIAPSQNTILDDQIPLLSRTAEGLANLAQKLQA